MQLDAAVAPAGTTTVNILTPADYELSPTLEPSGAVVQRIRGWVHPMSDTDLCPWAAMVQVRDLDEPAGAVAGATLIDQDVMWGGAGFASIDGTQPLELDIKAKRRLRNDIVSFTFTNYSGASVIRLTTLWRLLVRIGS